MLNTNINRFQCTPITRAKIKINVNTSADEDTEKNLLFTASVM